MLSALGDREAQVGLLAGAGVARIEAHVVAAVGDGGRRRGRQRHEVGAAVDTKLRSQRVGLLGDREVGEQSVGAGLVEFHVDRPTAIGCLLGVKVLEARQVAPGDDEVHALVVLDVEVAHGVAGVVDDAETHLLPAAAA